MPNRPVPPPLPDPKPKRLLPDEAGAGPPKANAEPPLVASKMLGVPKFELKLVTPPDSSPLLDPNAGASPKREPKEAVALLS